MGCSGNRVKRDYGLSVSCAEVCGSVCGGADVSSVRMNMDVCKCKCESCVCDGMDVLSVIV